MLPFCVVCLCYLPVLPSCAACPVLPACAASCLLVQFTLLPAFATCLHVLRACSARLCNLLACAACLLVLLDVLLHVLPACVKQMISVDSACLRYILVLLAFATCLCWWPVLPCLCFPYVLPVRVTCLCTVWSFLPAYAHYFYYLPVLRAWATCACAACLCYLPACALPVCAAFLYELPVLFCLCYLPVLIAYTTSMHELPACTCPTSPNEYF